MLRSMFSGVSGLKNHQIKMDVIGNNIANVNTVAYKASRIMFQDVYSQTTKRSMAPTEGGLGGLNASQIGIGVNTGSIDIIHSRTGAQRTDNPLDCAIEGEGFFVLQTGDGTQETYTRAGNFYIDIEGNLVTNDGLYVMNMDRGIINIPEEYYDIAITNNGQLIGVNREDGTVEEIGDAPIALVTFMNTSGLKKVGQNQYAETPNSGIPSDPVQPGTEGTGFLNVGALEMSNVDLSTEMTELIIAQRGFQANSRVITTSDGMLEELINLKR